ncbi:MAG: M64 family metallopeptidase, partial [Malacoplasma sp.]|nr:M64 family metallopeptidase [Malacoplasma sp.]
TYYNAIENIGYKKANLLNFDFTNNFADSGTALDSYNLNIINKNSGIRAVTNYNVTLTSVSDTDHTGMHELGHLKFNLEDEYQTGSSYGANADVTNDPNNVKWKEFLNYKDVGIFNRNGSNNQFIPTLNSKMNYGTNLSYKEVSEHYISKLINNQLNLGNDLYIADPQLVAKEKFDDDYSQAWSNLWKEVFDENVTKANDKNLELRTVIDNWSDKERTFKLQIKIRDSNNNQKYFKESAEYVLQPNQKKGIFLRSDEKITGLLKTDKIIGQVIDCETNQVLATSIDRMNSSIYEIDENGTQKKFNAGTKMYNVNVEYKIKSTNETIPNTYPVSLRYSDGDDVAINKVVFNGYRFVESSDSDMKVHLNGQDENVTLYYEPLQHKTINLKLFDEDKKTVIQQKQVKVFEHQNFTPKNTDFWVQNLQTNQDNEVGWNYKVIPESNKSYNYNEISDNSITINYYKKADNSNIIFTEDVIGYKGEKMIFGHNNIQFYSSDYLLESSTIPAIFSNNVDINTPGEYEIVYYDSDTSTATQKVIIKDKQMPNDWTPNYLEAEDRRVGSIFFMLKDRKITRDEYNQINKTNLLSKLKNPVIDNEKFKYSIDSIEKKESGMLNFSLNITHNGVTKKCTNTWTLFFNIDSDNNPNPPTPTEPDKPNKEDKKNISDVFIDFIDGYKYYYTGKYITPEIIVYYKDENNNLINLINNQDYEINYQNNLDAGEATITIFGINNFYNSKQVTFNIFKTENNEISDFKIVNDKPIANSKFGDVKFRYCKNPNDENCVYYDKPNEIGIWYIQAYVEDSNNFNASSSDWKIINVKDMSNFTNYSNDNNNDKDSKNNQIIMIVGIILAIVVIIS